MNKLVAQVPRLFARQAAGRRAFGKSARSMKEEPLEPISIESVKLKQKQYQLDDGIPVFLKGGAPDKILFGTTVALCIFGLGYGSTIIYELAMPPKN